MIQPQEIRIGNYYKGASRGNIEIVTWQTLRDLSEGKLNLLPIPLTEEILLKFCFKYREFLNDFFIKIDNENILIIEKEVIGFSIFNCEPNQRKYFLTKIYYVHQLQNLYFALTSEELKFEDIS